MSVVAIVQARMGSNRLPGKVMREVEGKPLLQHMLERISRSKSVDEIIVATSSNEIDSDIEYLCNQLNIRCFRGSENDVLDRFYQCAKSFEPIPQYIVRLTADCPLHDPKVIDFVVEKIVQKQADCAINSFEPMYEDGFDVAVFTYSALEDAWKNATKKSEREHVTPYIIDSNELQIYKEKYCSKYNYKLSVDTLFDFELIKQIFAKLYKYNKDFGIKEVVDLLENEPSLLRINKESVINAGYEKSLSEDEILDNTWDVHNDESK